MSTDVATRNRASTLRAALVRRGHGVGGEVRVQALGQDPQRFVAGLRLIREDTGGVLEVVAARALGDGDVLLRFAGMETPEQVGDLGGVYLCVGREDARRLGPDEWFVSDLIGLRAITPAGDDLGVVSDVEAYPAHDIVVVGEGPGASRFPLVREFVAGVDLEAGTMTITPWAEA